jgi:DNA-binding transcriptional regulator YbjK
VRRVHGDELRKEQRGHEEGRALKLYDARFAAVTDAADTQGALLEERLVARVELVGAMEFFASLRLAVETARHRAFPQQYALLAVQAWLARLRDLADSRCDERFGGRDTVLSVTRAGQAEFIARIL